MTVEELSTERVKGQDEFGVVRDDVVPICNRAGDAIGNGISEVKNEPET